MLASIAPVGGFACCVLLCRRVACGQTVLSYLDVTISHPGSAPVELDDI